jgi:hypothetical protein
MAYTKEARTKVLGDGPRSNAKYYTNKKARVDFSKELSGETLNEKAHRLSHASVN